MSQDLKNLALRAKLLFPKSNNMYNYTSTEKWL